MAKKIKVGRIVNYVDHNGISNFSLFVTEVNRENDKFTGTVIAIDPNANEVDVPYVIGHTSSNWLLTSDGNFNWVVIKNKTLLKRKFQKISNVAY